jgi:GAF domain-containing protein
MAHEIWCGQSLTENQRIHKLHEYFILDTSAEQVFDDIAVLAAQLCGTPVALVTLLDTDRIWFKAKKGITANEINRDGGFCAEAILHEDVLVVSNALNDNRFSTNPLVTSELHIRFYAGVPLRTSTGEALGTLCVLDRVPRELTAEQIESLRALARQVMAQLELRHKEIHSAKILAETKNSEQLLRQTLDMQTALLNSANVSIIATDNQSIITVFNHTAEMLLGYRPRVRIAS